MAFLPRHLATVNINVSSSNQRVAIPGSRCASVRVMNDGSATVWIEFGNSSVTATTTTCMPIGAGKDAIFTANLPSPADTDLYVAAIAAGATGKIYFTPGDGA